MHRAREVGRFSARLQNQTFASAYVLHETAEEKIWSFVPKGHVVGFPQDLTLNEHCTLTYNICKIITAYLNHI